ncbi:hypothetical protein [Mariprofundus sp. EBB-1]|nr:hypothetical protein [Mariprofundus sp. EBB-1]
MPQFGHVRELAQAAHVDFVGEDQAASPWGGNGLDIQSIAPFNSKPDYKI